MKTAVYTLDSAITNHSIPVLERDDLLENDNDGVRFLFDLANTYCYQPGSPSNGKAVKDMSELSADGSISSPAGLLKAGGGGVDFSDILESNNGIRVPATVLADLFADQEYLVCSYVKMPASSDWPAAASGLNGTWLTACSGTQSYVNSAELALVVCSLTSVGRVNLRRQTALNVNGTDIALTGQNTVHGGLLTQLAFWRTATEVGLRLKSSGGTSLVTDVSGSKNSVDFSAEQFNFGPFGNFGYGVPSASWVHNQRLYRGWVGNLIRWGVAPITTLDADYTRTVARGVYT